MKHILNQKYLYSLILCSFILHIISVNFSIGFYSDDEHFQILEITAYLLGINEIAINDPTNYYWEWEEGTRIRPWIQPYIFYKIINILQFFGADNPFFWSFFLRLILSIIGFFSIIYLFFVFRNIFFKKNKIFNYFLYFTFWFYPFLHSRTSSENLSITIYIISFCILYQILESRKYRYNFYLFSFGSFLMGMSMATKFTNVFSAFPFFLWFLINRFSFKKIFIFGLFVILALCLGLYIDYIHWGSFKNTYYQFYHHNLSSGTVGKMKYFGIDPWYYYITETTKQLAPVLSLFFCIGILFFWIRKKNDVFTWITIIPFIVLSYIGHKEIRYIFPLYIFAPFFVGYFFEKFTIKYIALSFKFLIIFSNIVFLLITSFTPANSKVAVYKYIYEEVPKNDKIYYSNENPYLVNNMEAFFYTSFLQDINNLENNKSKDETYWITTNNYEDLNILLQNNCLIKYSTYPKEIINLNQNWKRLKLNWYILRCN